MRWIVAMVALVLGGCSSGAQGTAAEKPPTPSAETPPPAPSGETVTPSPPPAPACAFPPVSMVPFTKATAADGTVVRTFAPTLPVGVLIALHGTGGSSTSLAENKIEWASFFEEAKMKSYALVVPESKDRAKKQWDTTPSAQNVDAVRIEAILEKLVTTGAFTVATPIYVLGMSQGGGAAPILATLLKGAGRAVRAVGVYCAGKSPAYANENYTLPTTFSLMAADQIVTGSAEVEANVATLKARGIDAQVAVKPAEPICAKRFARVPGISEEVSAEIHAALVAAGTLDKDGRVANAGGEADTSTSKTVVGLPAAHASFEKAVREQLDVAAAVHAFFGDHNATTLSFFDQHR